MTKLTPAGQEAPGVAAPAAWVLTPPPRQRWVPPGVPARPLSREGEVFGARETLRSPGERAAPVCPVFHFDPSVLRCTKEKPEEAPAGKRGLPAGPSGRRR